MDACAKVMGHNDVSIENDYIQVFSEGPQGNRIVHVETFSMGIDTIRFGLAPTQQLFDAATLAAEDAPEQTPPASPVVPVFIEAGGRGGDESSTHFNHDPKPKPDSNPKPKPKPEPDSNGRG